jgi:hypothetical protein
MTPQKPRDGQVFDLFFAYLLFVAVAFFSIPLLLNRLFHLIYLPDEYGWVFLFIFPQLAVGLLWLGVRTGKYSAFAVRCFWAAALAVGGIILWFSYYISQYAK